MEETLSLKEVVKIIKKRLLLIFSLIVVAGSIAAIISFYMLTPRYHAQTEILVNQKNISDEGYLYSRIEIDLQLISTYNNIITSPFILDKVIKELEINTSPKQLANQITLSSENGSKVLFIDVIHSDAELAVNIANTTAKVFQDEVPKLLNVDNINILSAAAFNDTTYPISPNIERNIGIGVVIGLALGVGLAFLLEILDSTIKDEKDIEEILGIPIMGIVGSIPLEKEKKASFKSLKGRGSRDARINV